MAIAEEEKAGIPEWVVTFGDMMSLLLTFFIMLVSMSEIKEEQRFQAMVDAMRRRFGHDAASISVVPGDAKPRNSALSKLATMGRARRANIMKGGDKVKAPVGDYPRVLRFQTTGQATVGGSIYFTEGSAELDRRDKRVLQATAAEVGGKPQKIEIRGHTSTRPLPPDSSFRDHWDLAYARCCVVRDFLVKLGIDPKRIRMAVAADKEPRHIGVDPLLLRENPRVEIFILAEWVGDLQGTAEEKREKISTQGAP